MIGRISRCLLLLILLLGCGAAAAHKASDSYLRIAVAGNQLQVHWDIALRDLQTVLALDGNGDGAITWGELRARHTDIAAYALARLSLRSADAPCVPRGPELQVDRHTDGAYAVLRFTADCTTTPRELDIAYHVFFEVDRQHRGLLQLHAAGTLHTAVFSPEHPRQQVETAHSDRLRQFAEYLREGAWHIAIGYDHILFLIALLLPVVLQRQTSGWRPAATLSHVLGETLKLVTAFTLAHSLTLGLAVTDTLQFPSRWVESAIAASVLLTAVDNIVPLFRCPRWWISFGFGLIHGFGFANVLAELGLPQDALLWALLAFNLGVEVGQLLIVAAVLPLLHRLRGWLLYPHAVLGAGSLAAAGMALLWLIERATDVTL